MSFNKKDNNLSTSANSKIYSHGNNKEIHDVIVIVKNQENNKPKIIIKKKIIKKAVDRNKVRRRIKEIFKNINNQKKMTIFVIVKKNILNIKYQILEKKLKNELIKQIESEKK